MNLSYSDAKKLANALLARAIRDAINGSDDAREWLRSDEAEMWIYASGYDAEAIKGKIISFCDHPKMVKQPKIKKVKHQGYFDKLWGLSAT
jgi:hypothetical protein